MLHFYEIRELNKDLETKIIRQFTADPKTAKQEFKKYTEENPGIYSLYQIHRVAAHFTVKEDQHE